MRIQREEIDPDIIADFSIILGDLNYRMEGTFESLVPQIDKIVGKRKELDQLYKTMTDLEKYPDYLEQEIKFKPTYKRNKYEPGYFNKKSQAPSYTDRILFKNNTSNTVLYNSYTSLDHVHGSDHRPVQLDMDILLKPYQFLQMPDLINPALGQKHGVGVFTFNKLRITNLNLREIEGYTKKHLVFPSHLQLSFYADHLESFVSSFEHTLQSRSQQTLEWKGAELPQVFTAANSIPLIADKRLVILLWLTNEQQSDQEVIGQVNVKMSEALDGGCITCSQIVKGEIKKAKIIMANNLMGTLEGEFTFEVLDACQASRRSTVIVGNAHDMSPDLKQERRKWANMAFKKFQRDHSA